MTAKTISGVFSAVLVAAALAFVGGCSREEPQAEKAPATVKSAAEKRAEDAAYMERLKSFSDRQAKDASAIAAVRRQIAALGKDAPFKPEYASLTNRLAQLEAAQRQTNQSAVNAIRARLKQDSGRTQPSAK